MESLGIVFDNLPYILRGSFFTIAIVAFAMALGLCIGVPLGVCQVYGGKCAKKCVGVYVWFFRGTPILVLLYLFHFGILPLLRLDFSAFAAVCIVLGLTSAAYQSQIFRGAILSLPQGQLKAARALGMSDIQAIRYIILPQTLRLAIPGWSNEYSIMLKDSALAFVLGTQDIMARTHFVASRTYEHLPLYVCAGILYLVITLIGVKALRLLEKKVRIPGYGLH